MGPRRDISGLRGLCDLIDGDMETLRVVVAAAKLLAARRRAAVVDGEPKEVEL